MYPHVALLPPAQRGELLSALFEFAALEADVPNSGIDILDSHPDMTPECRMAYGFISEAIHRDTAKWHEKQQRYRQAAQVRELMRCREDSED